MPPKSSRYARLPEYLLASLPQKKRELAARGVDVIDLGAGDADLAPPSEAIAALERAAHDPARSRYGFGAGLPACREGVSRSRQRRFAASAEPMSGTISRMGSKEGIAHLALAYLDPGDVA